MRLLRFKRIVEDFNRAEVAHVDECRVPDERLAAPLNFHELGQFAESPVRHGVCAGKIARHFGILLRHGAEGFLRLASEFSAQLRKIPPHGKLPSVFINHLEIKDEMRGELLRLEIRRRAGNAKVASNVVGKRLQKARGLRRAVLHSSKEAFGVLCNRHAVPANFLRKALE